MVGHYDVNAPFRFTGSTSIPIEEYGNPFDVMGSGGGVSVKGAEGTSDMASAGANRKEAMEPEREANEKAAMGREREVPTKNVMGHGERETKAHHTI